MRTESGNPINYGRWLCVGDTEELVRAVSCRPYELGLVKCDDRTGEFYWGSGSQDCSHGAERNKQYPKEGHNSQGE